MGNNFELERLERFLRLGSIPYKSNHSLKYELYFKRGGVARLYIAPSTLDQLIHLINYLREIGVDFKIIGLSSNVLFLDELQYGVVISTKGLTCVCCQDGRFEVECGYPLQDFVRVALVHGYGGLEGLEGVPGSLGGALVMNAGAYGFSISDYLVSVKTLMPDGKVSILRKDECEFNFRSSIFRSNPDYIVLSAIFNLPSVDRRMAARDIEVYHIARHSYQEFAYPNLGSMFSVKKDFYLEVFEKDRFLKLAFIALKLLLKNPLAKLISRKRPHNKYFNKMVLGILRKDLNYVPSVKSMNILINDGSVGTEELINYISEIRRILPMDTQLENEIVLSPIYLNDSRALKVVEYIKRRGLLNENSIANNTLGK